MGWVGGWFVGVGGDGIGGGMEMEVLRGMIV